MLERIFTILKKEFLQVLRDPRMKTTIFISPMVQVLIFGYAATMDITNVPTAVYDLDNTKESREVMRDFSYSQYFNIKRHLSNEQQMLRVIDRSSVNAVFKFNRGFARDIVGNNNAQLQVIVDGTDSNAASIILSYAGQITGKYNYRRMQERLWASAGKEVNYPSVDLRDRRWFNENLESKNFFLPGVIALIVTMMSLLLSSMAIVREKEIGTMEQLIVSPIRPIELMLGKLIPFGIIALVQLCLITTIGVLWFHLPVRGSFFFLFICTLAYLLTSLGAGLFISTVSSTQQEAMMSVFLFYFPATLLSGFAYPIANMPKLIQYITYLNPLRYYLVILRSIFLKGSGIRLLWDELCVLLIIGVGVIVLSSLRFRKRLG
ncbi:MAG: ABC transporter permease [Candidatus Omnitrophica bacterium]|nr:ABC transporter permease [Candidatus Omnitrophota bacterium]